MEGYLDQVYRWVTRSKNVLLVISMEWILEIIDDFIDGDAKGATEEYMYDCTDTTQGVFKAYAVSLTLKWI